MCAGKGWAAWLASTGRALEWWAGGGGNARLLKENGIFIFYFYLTFNMKQVQSRSSQEMTELVGANSSFINKKYNNKKINSYVAIFLS